MSPGKYRCVSAEQSADKRKVLDSILNLFTWAWAQPIPQTFLCTAQKKGICCTESDSSDPTSLLQLLGSNPCE